MDPVLATGLILLIPPAVLGLLKLGLAIRDNPKGVGRTLKTVGLVSAVACLPFAVVVSLVGLVRTLDSAQCNNPEFASKVEWCYTNYGKGPAR